MRKLLLGVLVGAAIVGGGTALYALLFRVEPTAPEWVVASYSGRVLVSRSGGDWEDATMKARLADGDSLKTGDDGEATLVHDSSHVTVRPATEMKVAALNEESSKFQIAEGNVLIEARGDRISVRSASGARVDAKDAGLGMSVRRDGDVTIQVARGVADFSSMGGTERVTAGHQSVAHAGQQPTAPVPIPQSILLNVRFPDSDTFNTRLARIEGVTEAGNRVLVGNRWVEVGADGTWSTDVVLDEGVNQVEVTARDALGRERLERSAPIRVDVTAPDLLGASIGSRSVGAETESSQGRATR